MFLLAGLPRVAVTQQGPYRVQEGASVSIECVGEGTPPPSVHWEGPGDFGMVPGRTSGSAVLRIRTVTPAHSGTYKCIVSNAVGQSHISIEIIGV